MIQTDKLSETPKIAPFFDKSLIYIYALIWTSRDFKIQFSVVVTRIYIHTNIFTAISWVKCKEHQIWIILENLS